MLGAVFCRLEKAWNQARGQQMSKCPARTWFNSSTWKKTSPVCSCSSPVVTAQHINWKTPTIAGQELSPQKRMLVNSTGTTVWEGWSAKQEHFMQMFYKTHRISLLPLISPQYICNCVTINDAKFTFVNKKTSKHSTNLKVGKTEYLCFVCCGSLQGDAFPQKSLGQTCHSTFALTQHTWYFANSPGLCLESSWPKVFAKSEFLMDAS